MRQYLVVQQGEYDNSTATVWENSELLVEFLKYLPKRTKERITITALPIVEYSPDDFIRKFSEGTLPC